MVNYTLNYNLKKPIGSERYDICVDNVNYDIIDTALNGLTLSVTTHIADASKHPQLSKVIFNLQRRRR